MRKRPVLVGLFLAFAIAQIAACSGVGSTSTTPRPSGNTVYPLCSVPQQPNCH